MAVPDPHPLTQEPLLAPVWHQDRGRLWPYVRVLVVAGDWLKLQPLGADFHPLRRPGWAWVPTAHLAALEPVYAAD